MTCLSCRLLWIALFGFVCTATSLGQSPQAPPSWKLESIPAYWKSYAGKADTYAWFRCKVSVPASWAGEELTLFIEGVDDAREVFFNGTSIGLVGTFPPEFRSGLGATMRFPIRSDLVVADGANVVAVRVYQNRSRGGFNVAAPVLFGNEQAIRMAGSWEFAEGDQEAWSKLSTRSEIHDSARFAKLESAQAVEDSLRSLDDDPGAQSVENTIQKLTFPADLTVDVPLAEPHIGQPLSIKWDSRGRMWVMQYLQYPTIAGLKMISRDKFLRSVYDKVPPAPPNHFVGADKISIHEDTDGDGTYDKHKTFVEGLNLATSVCAALYEGIRQCCARGQYGVCPKGTVKFD